MEFAENPWEEVCVGDREGEKTPDSKSQKGESGRASGTDDNVADESDEALEDDFGDFGEFEEVEVDRPAVDYSCLSRLGRGTGDDATMKFEGDWTGKYLRLVAAERQWQRQHQQQISYRGRAAHLETETHRRVEAVAALWTSVEKRVATKAGVTNLFSWSSTRETAKPAKKTQQINSKLLRTATAESRAIIDRRLEAQRQQKQKLEKERHEREKRIREERQRREQEALKYRSVAAVPQKKERTLFGRLFGEKSKIAADNLSHDKIVQPAQTADDADLISEFREQLQRREDSDEEDREVDYGEIGAGAADGSSLQDIIDQAEEDSDARSNVSETFGEFHTTTPSQSSSSPESRSSPRAIPGNLIDL
ncbi:hypothetical protein KL914_004280 [Ogataea haglerorum]|uniref:Uncharacterized protein n=1 Tax=Ogataea haglerorum TaxID=1937702 RepID=A0ABQ7RC11_9ASCO|nr:hypothetical protein KL914_004280 [Ogataea haglerorum]KAG7762928.1 hypothetical protein KL946_004280 [Ogataea haglerorum]